MSEDKFLIKGLAGKRTLKGKIKINGAKNASLKALASTILFDDTVTLNNVPHTDDIKKMISILSGLGAEISENINGKIKISCSSGMKYSIDKEKAKAMRASVVLTGPILSRFGKVTFPAPGGCVIGARPIEFFLASYEKMGAKVSLSSSSDEYVIEAPKEGLNGADIFFKWQSVGATETLMMAGVLAKGKTVLRNCAMEPEIVNLADFLINCGAKISGAGTPTIEIEGGELLKSNGKEYFTVSDRIEAGSYLILSALCAEDVLIENCEPDHLRALTSSLIEAGVKMEISDSEKTIRVLGPLEKELKPLTIKTHEYPGFPTDLQAQMAVFLTQCNGDSFLFETIFEGRLRYVEELIKLRANIKAINSRELIISGKTPLKARGDTCDNNGRGENSGDNDRKTGGGDEDNSENCAEILNAHDIRAGFAVVMAGILAEGRSEINGIKYIDRGYEKIEEKLRDIGVDIKRVA